MTNVGECNILEKISKNEEIMYIAEFAGREKKKLTGKKMVLEKMLVPE